MNKCKKLLTKAKPILFNTDMVRAILDGRKTVTRQVVKPQPVAEMPDNHNICKMPILTKDGQKSLWYMDVIEQYPFSRTRYFEQIAPYEPGDILYVRETWRIWKAHRYDADAHIEFKAGGQGTVLCFSHGCTDSVNREDHDSFIGKWGVDGKWHPSIHMPKEAARIILKVTNVRVEQLQDITEDDIVYEGAEKLILCPNEHGVIEPDETLGDMCWNTECCGGNCKYINKSYGELFGEVVWNSTVKKKDLDKYGWEANPWVWVIEFERMN